MKLTLTLIIAFSLLTFAACTNDSKPDSNETISSQPEIPTSQSSDNQPPSESSYEGFFSQIVDFEYNQHETDDTQVFIYQDDVDNAIWKDGGYFLDTFPDAVEGYLYLSKVITDSPDSYSREYISLLEEQVTEFFEVGDRVFCAIGNTLYSIDRSGGDKQVVLTANGSITNLKANNTLVFYVANEYLYRHYIPDNITDKLCYVPGILPGFPIPISNHQIYWGAYDPDGPENDYRSWHKYTGPDGDVEEISPEEMARLYSEKTP